MSTTMNTTYKIAIGADHAGVDLKETVAELLKAWGHEVTDMGTMEVQVGANEHQLVKARIPKISSETLYLDTVDVTTMAGPDKALDTLDDAIAMVSDARSKIGAYTNRLDYSSSSLAQTDEDLTAAFSRIKDIDMATEMTTYANQQVLQQAGTSVLAQANDIPQQVLQLLQ